MNRSLGVIGTSFIAIGLVAILLLPSHRPTNRENLPREWRSFEGHGIFHPASPAKRVASETAAAKSTRMAAKAEQRSQR